MARIFGELELGYMKEVLESRQLGWAEGGLVTRFERPLRRRLAVTTPSHAIQPWAAWPKRSASAAPARPAR